MTTAATLTELIDQLVNEKTFSLEGVKAIEQMRQKAEQQQAKIEALAARSAEQVTEIAQLKADNERKAAELTEIKKREADLKVRETAVAAHETLAAVSKAEAAAYKHSMEIVFKPNTVREKIVNTIPLSQNMQGGGSYVAGYSKTDEVTREEGA